MSNLVINPELLPSSLTLSGENEMKFFLSTPIKSKEAKTEIILKENATLDFTLVDFARTDFDYSLNISLKRGARVIFSLASLGFEDTAKVFHFNVSHEEGNTYSRVSMNGINNKNGVLKFLGNSLIVNGAHKSDTRQEGKITNLSIDCKSEVSPALLIKENDVNASHGAALGAYNPDELFYLMSRGLSLDESKKLITFGTLLPVLEKLGDQDIIEKAKASLQELTL